MSEGQVYLCHCEVSDDNYTLTLHANPDIACSGADLAACSEDICMQIGAWNGDGEAALELFPTPGGSGIEGGAVLFAMLGYHESAATTAYDTLFLDGVCPVCKFGVGRRSEVSLDLERTPQQLVCSVDRCLPILMVYHRRFVAALTEEERSAYELRPVLVSGNPSNYVELIAHRTIAVVGYTGAEYPTAFQQSIRCGGCERQKFEAQVKGAREGAKFIDARDIEDGTAGMIVVDDGWRRRPSFRLPRWQQLLGDGKLHGLLSDDLVVLTPEYSERPQLAACNEFDWVL